MFSASSFVVDTNVWVDFFLRVSPHYEKICSFFELVSKRGGTLAYAPTTLKDVFFIIPRRLRREAHGDEQAVSFTPAAWACMRMMTEIAVAAPQSLAECELAWMLRNAHDDLEDNLVIAAAETCNADYVVTYDKQMLERFAPACITPERALELLSIV